MQTKMQERLLSSVPEGQFRQHGDDVWTWYPFPGFGHHTVLLFVGPDILVVRGSEARVSEAGLIRFTRSLPQDVCESTSPSSPSLWRRSSEEIANRRGICIQHPSLSHLGPISKSTAWAAPQMWFGFPAAECEIGRSETIDEVYARERVWVGTELASDVTPFTKTRSLRKKSKIRAGGAGKSRGVGRWTEVVRVFELLAEEDGFLEIENYEREVARVDHEGGYVITVRDTEYEREPVDARAWLEAFAKQGVEASLEVLAP